MEPRLGSGWSVSWGALGNEAEHDDAACVQEARQGTVHCSRRSLSLSRVSFFRLLSVVWAFVSVCLGDGAGVAWWLSRDGGWVQYGGWMLTRLGPGDGTWGMDGTALEHARMRGWCDGDVGSKTGQREGGMRRMAMFWTEAGAVKSKRQCGISWPTIRQERPVACSFPVGLCSRPFYFLIFCSFLHSYFALYLTLISTVLPSPSACLSSCSSIRTSIARIPPCRACNLTHTSNITTSPC